MGIIAGSRLRASPVNTSSFIIEVDTTKAGTPSDQFQFTGAEGDYDVVAKQNDIVVATFNDLSGQQTITLPSSGVFILEVSAKSTNGFTGLRFNNSGDKRKLTKINQWGVFSDTRDSLFSFCVNLTQIADDNDWLNSITDGTLLFQLCGLTSLPTTLTLSSLVIGSQMFQKCPIASLPSEMTLNNLDSGIAMFIQCDLTSLPSGMILNDLRNGQNMFNSNNLSELPIQMTLNSLEKGDQLFRSNNLTDLPVGIKFGSLTDGELILSESTINTTRYSQLLVDMENLNSNNNLRFHGGNSEYNTTGETARDLLTTNQSWTISDGGLE
jgi:hypothetical protein